MPQPQLIRAGLVVTYVEKVLMKICGTVCANDQIHGCIYRGNGRWV